MADDFQQDYKQLELEQQASFKTAHMSYRRLVNHWHPDRYAQRPRERQHAQQKFIELTKSFNNLRNFHRQNDRLPFEHIEYAPVSTADTESPTRSSAEEELQSGLFRQKHNRSSASIAHLPLRRGLLWVVPGALLLFATLGFFVVIDRAAKRDSIEQAKQVLRQTKASEFMPSAVEVKKQSSRGAFVEQQGSQKLGDQLMPNIFQ